MQLRAGRCIYVTVASFVVESDCEIVSFNMTLAWYITVQCRKLFSWYEYGASIIWIVSGAGGFGRDSEFIAT